MTNYISYLAEEQIPASYDWLWSGLGAVIVIGLLVFWVASLISIIRSGYSGGVKVLLVMAAFAYPFLGPLVWFLFARNKVSDASFWYRCSGDSVLSCSG